ncbi:hypothetical protein O5O45_16485 [Hahella aquimaris]|uniref:hypothetical protein n=1 Tax=Hahella sp. HNIBRBA332 TaxID=3015983 RepID=UPI00273B34DA|nr:hypothetical protein [Hahella sp. HNIBRBA332]WLQ11344.1 hypothetical protein O5O45_16485 [Hahella sp. HNIBRBA332]
MKKAMLLAAALGSLMQNAGAEEFRVQMGGEKIIYIETSREDEFDRRDYDQYMRERGYDYESHYHANRRLRERVRNLELAVRQLQDTVYDLQNAEPTPPPVTAPQTQYSCILKTHKGTFTGIGLTKLEATGKAAQQCESKIGAFWCDIDEVKCDAN